MYRLAVNLVKQGRINQAQKMCGNLLATLERNPEPELFSDVHNVLAAIELQNNNLMAVISLCEKGLKAHRNPRLLNTLSIACLKMNSVEKALSAIDEAIAQSPNTTDFYRNKVEVLLALKDTESAKQILKSRLKSDYSYYYSMGRLARMEKDSETAIAVLRQAITIDPGNQQVYEELKFAYLMRDDFESAVFIMNQALVAGIEDASIYRDIAVMSEKINQLEEATIALDHLTRHIPDDPVGLLTLATIRNREQKDHEALSILARIKFDPSSDRFAPDIYYLKARCLENVGRYDEAFEAATTANQLKLNDETENLVRKSRNTIEQQLNIAKSVARSEPSEEGPVFLIGFPRSGTTLIGLILDAHPEISVFHEDPELTKAARNKGNPDSVNKNYWQTVRRRCETNPKVLVDKNPLNIIWIPRLLEVFPGAKFILVLRDPRDAILSCFFQNFTIYPETSNFLDWERSLTYYNEVMDAWLQFKKLLDPPVHEIRLEEFTKTPEPITQPLLEFLDVSWDASILQVEKRRNTKRVVTPSYRQVVEDINSRSANRWQRFEKLYANYNSLLHPHLESFGYSTD